MKKTVAYLGVSLDGYIATADERVDWLETVETDGDAGYQDLYDSIDTVVMGRTTYEWICDHMDEYPYMDKESYIITHQQTPELDHVHFTKELTVTIEELKKGEGKNIWIVGGGKLISQMINEQLLDELRLTIAPLLLGTGIPLFTGVAGLRNMRLTNTIRYQQFVELDYAL